MIASLLPVAACGAALVTQSAPTAPESLLRAAPEGTLMALVCDDVPGLIAGLRASPLGVLWEDESLADLRAKLDATVTSTLAEEVYPGGPPAGELVEGLRGAALFLGDLEAEDVPLSAFAVSVDDELVHELAAMLAAEETQSELVRVDGRELHVRRDESAGWTVAGTWLQGLVLAFGSDRERALEWAGSVVRALDAEPSRATERGAQFLARRGSGAPALEAHVDLGSLMRLSLQRSEAGDEVLSAPREALETLGLAKLGWASASLAVSRNGACDARMTCDVPSGTLGRLLAATRPAPLALGRLAPPGTIDASFLGLDTQALWAGVRELVAEIGGPEPGESDAARSDLLERRLDEIDALIGVDLREAVIENLTGEFARFVLPDDLAYVGPGDAPLAAYDTVIALLSPLLPQVGAVQVIGLRNGSAMEELIDGVIGLAGADGVIVEHLVGERWFQSIRIPGWPGLEPCWAVLDDALLISAGPPALRAVVARIDEDDAPSWLTADPRAKVARALSGEGAFCVGAADQRALFERRVLRPLREVHAAIALDSYGGAAAAMIQRALPEDDPAADFERARGYLRRAIEVGERLRERGLEGDWLSTATLRDGRLSFRTWTRPALREGAPR